MNKKTTKALETGLFIFGCVGVVITAIAAGRDSLRAEKTLYNHTHEERDEVRAYFASDNSLKENFEDILDITKTCARDYVPTILISTTTITALIFSRHLNKKEIATLASLSSSSMYLVNKYREKIKEISKDTYEEIEREIAKERENKVEIANAPVISSPSLMSCDVIDLANDGEVLFYDQFMDRWFRSSRLAVNVAEYHLNRNFALGGAVPLSMFYAFLGLDTPEEYSSIGWDVEDMQDSGIYWIDFEHIKSKTDDGEEYYILNYTFDPSEMN